MTFITQLSIALATVALISILWSYMLACVFLTLAIITGFLIYHKFGGQKLETCNKCGKIYEYSGVPICEDCLNEFSKLITKGTE